MQLTSLKDKYRGERIFIIGNGPSLKGAQLNLIKDEYSFAMNRIGLIFARTDWRPTFYFCATVRAGIKDYGLDVRQAMRAAKHSFICDRLKEFIDNRYGSLTYVKCLHIGAKFSNPTDDWWSRDISDGKVSIYGTSAFGVTRIAAYMGFNPIYMLGFDLNYKARKQKEADPNHFSKGYELGNYPITAKWLKNEIPRMLKSHELTYKLAKEQGIDIYNVTKGGQVEAYPRISLKEVLNG